MVKCKCKHNRLMTVLQCLDCGQLVHSRVMPSSSIIDKEIKFYIPKV